MFKDIVSLRLPIFDNRVKIPLLLFSLNLSLVTRFLLVVIFYSLPTGSCIAKLVRFYHCIVRD